MEHNFKKYITKNVNDSFLLSKDNMNHDIYLLNALNKNQRIERLYQWQQPAITYSYKQECPLDMLHLDHFKRVTGGGLVFHSPGDIVFSISFWMDDPLYKGSLLTKLQVVSDKIKSDLINAGILIDTSFSSKLVNYDRCMSYPTPFEIIIKGQKRCGLTIRKMKDKCLIQGIIHKSVSHDSFRPFLSEKEFFFEPMDIEPVDLF